MFDFIKKPVEELGKSVLEPVGRWVMLRSWPVRAAILLIVATAGFAAYAPGYVGGLIGEARDYWAARNAGTRIVVDAERVQALDRAIATLRVAAAGDAARPTDKDATAWSISQSVAALTAAGGSVDNRDAIEAFINRTIRPGCFCWTELPSASDDASVFFIGGWVAYAEAGMGVPLTPAAIDQILDAQNSAGWWPMFKLVPGREGASSYTTAWLVLGLAEQRGRKLIPASHRARVDAAVDRAALWLATVRGAGARWQSFPYLTGSPQSESISGLVIHALHRSGGRDMREIDREWLSALPDKDVEARSLETYYTQLGGDGAESTIDHFAQVRQPWILMATVDAYPNGTARQRGQGLHWLAARVDDAELAKVDKVASLWWRAEVLIGLAHLRRQLG